MGTPQGNPEGYRDGSPINFAKNLKGDLMVIHGTGDDNCHYQTVELLINEFVKHNKMFSMLAYPNRSHSINEGENTSLHLRNSMTKYFLDHLKPGPE
jgi:dipeptidyl-peptidase-4